MRTRRQDGLHEVVRSGDAATLGDLIPSKPLLLLGRPHPTRSWTTRGERRAVPPRAPPRLCRRHADAPREPARARLVVVDRAECRARRASRPPDALGGAGAARRARRLPRVYATRVPARL